MTGELASATIDLQSPEATSALGQRLATLLAPGDVVLLSGEVGAGKTHLARALIQHRLQAAGQAEDVPSPSFTLVQTYDDGETEIWHVDLYRLPDNADLTELGLDAAFEEAICLIEWPERMGGHAPAGALSLRLERQAGESGRRRVTLAGRTDRWAERIAALSVD